ncbi:MAG: T9SS type A sorting domain-containing protein [Bacteroidota bacterium]
MLKHYKSLLLVLCLLGSTMLFAQSTETFDYTVGEGLEGQSGGDGWIDGWTFRKGTDQVSIQSGGISVAASGFTTTNNHAATVHNAGDGGTRQFRLLANPVAGDVAGTYYLSFVMDNQYVSPAANGSVHQVMLTNSAALAAGGPSGQRVRMGKLFGTAEFGIDGINAGGTATIPGTNTQEAFWAVIRLEMNTDGPENLAFFINPALGTDFATATPDLVTNPDLSAGFDAIGVKLEGGATLNGQVDEIRFSTAPGDITPPDLILSPGAQFDQFNEYAADSGLDGADGGAGFGGPWRVVSGADPTVTEGGIQNFSILKETSGNRVVMPYEAGGNSRLERPLNATFEDDGSTYYFSYHQQGSFSDLNGQVNYFMLLDTSAYAPTGPGGQLVQIGKPLNTPFIGAGIGATSNFELTGSAAADAHFVVVKVSTSGNADPDTVRLYIDPSLEIEPVTADATKLIGTNLNNGFNAVGFKVEGLSTGNVMEFDDVMVGLAYGDVIPPDLGDLQPLTDAFASDNFNTYPAAAALPGLEGGNGWDGPWTPFLSAVDSSDIRGGGLLNDNLQLRTSGSSLRMSSAGGNQRVIRLFEEPLDTTENADFWFSVHLGMEAEANDFVGNFILADTTLDGGAFQQLIIGKPFGNRNLFAGGFGQAGGNEPIVPNAFANNDVHWIVGHMIRENGQWLMDVFVNPDPEGGTPDESAAALMNKAYNSGNFNAIAVKAEANRGIDWLVDDIYFGDDFDAVVPIDFEPIPPAPPGASEPFDYASGSDYIGQNGGSGWAGPWELVSDTGSGEAVDEGLTSIPLLKLTAAPSLEQTVLQRAVRPLEGVYGDFGRDFWLGWWARTDNGANNVAHLILADTATYMAGGPGGQLVQIGKVFGGSTLGVVAAQGGNAPGDVSAGDGHFIVAHIITDGTADNDQILVWVDPALDTEPDPVDAAVDARADLTNWNAIGFKFEGTLGETVARFDDILLAGTFADVIPNDLTDIDPPALPVVGFELFDYDVASDIVAATGGEGWANAWTAVSGTALIAEGAIDNERNCGEGNMVNIAQSGIGNPVLYTRDFFNAFGREEGPDQVYMSFSLDIMNKDIGNSALVSVYNDDGNVLSIGGVPGLGDLAVIQNSENPMTTASASAIGPKWFVIRFDLNPDGDDSALIWLNPPGDAIPTDESALFSITGLDADDGLTGLALNVAGAQTASLFFDDFRIGFGYRDISCQFGSDDPELFAYEPFNYDPGQSVIGLGGVNAFWDGLWEDLAGIGENNLIEVDPMSLEVASIPTVGNRGELSFLATGNQIRVNRELAFPMESDGTTYWLSFFQNTTEGEATDNVGNIMLRNSGEAANAGQRLAFGRMFGGGKLGFITPPNNQSRESDFDDAGLNWIVAKIVTTGSDSPVDTVYMWVNPPAMTTEPDTSDASFFTVSTTPHLKIGIDYVMLKAEGAGANQVPYITEFDEVRITTSWPSALFTSTIEPLAEDVFQFSAYPNPFGDQVTFEYELPDAGPLNVSLYDMQGRLVTTIFDDEQAAGPQQLRFDSNANGRELANGFYLVRLVQNGRSIVRKLILYR